MRSYTGIASADIIRIMGFNGFRTPTLAAQEVRLQSQGQTSQLSLDLGWVPMVTSTRSANL